MGVNQDILYKNWHELKGQVQQRWDKLTNEDIIGLSGKTEELASILRERYGYGKTQAEIEINNWMSSHHGA